MSTRVRRFTTPDTVSGWSKVFIGAPRHSALFFSQLSHPVTPFAPFLRNRDMKGRTAVLLRGCKMRAIDSKEAVRGHLRAAAISFGIAGGAKSICRYGSGQADARGLQADYASALGMTAVGDCTAWRSNFGGFPTAALS
jgi:hypothetical protein